MLGQKLQLAAEAELLLRGAGGFARGLQGLLVTPQALKQLGIYLEDVTELPQLLQVVKLLKQGRDR